MVEREALIPYVGLHRHSMYSALDGFGTIAQIIERLQALGQRACAITDHGTLFGHVDFYHAMRKREMHPVLGCEFYHVPSREKHVRGGARDKDEQGIGIPHLTVLARTQEGYANLLALSRLSFEKGFYRKPTIDWDDLLRHQEGLVVLTGCVGSILSRFFYARTAAQAARFDLAIGRERAREHLVYLKERIEHLYVEIVACPGLQPSEVACRELWTLAGDLGIPTVVTDDAHFPRPEDHAAQDVMVCIQTHVQKHDPKRKMRIPEIHYHCTGEDAVARTCRVLPGVDPAVVRGAVERTVEIAEGCQVELRRASGPVYPVPVGLSPVELLQDWVAEGIGARIRQGLMPEAGSALEATYAEREEHEWSILRTHGFENYFLLVADIVRHCQAQDWWVIARGSCGGSLLCWYLGITQIDPVAHGLPVERFIDHTRPDLPDIDLDCDPRHREQIFRYLEQKYGVRNCAQIAALSTFRPKQAVLDVCKVFGDPAYGEEHLPASAGAAVVALLPEMEHEGGIKAERQLATLFETNERARALLARYPSLRHAIAIEGQVRQQTIHAAGFVVDGEPLDTRVGIQIARPKKGTSQRLVALDMGTAATMGLLKVDLLSVEAYGAIQEMLGAIGRDREWLYSLPLDDPDTYAMLAEGRNVGVFQLKGHTAGQVMREMRPSCFADLVALGALARPGPLQSGGAAEYVARKHGRIPKTAYPEAAQQIVDRSNGTIIYQEQIMALMQVAGFDLPDVHAIRKTVSKSGGAAKLHRYHEPYLEGMCRMGVSIEVAEHLWLQCLKAGSYSFNEAHSAAYALVGYWTAYLKCHHPGAFYAIALNHEKKEEYRLQLVREFRARGGRMALLDPNKSQIGFSSPEPDLLVGGFANIRGIGTELARKMAARQPYRNWDHFLTECPTNVARSLVAAGVRTGELSPDVVLLIAPWFTEMRYHPQEEEVVRTRGTPSISDVVKRMPRGAGEVWFVGRVTAHEETVAKGGDSRRPRCLVTIADPTGTIDVHFPSHRWAETRDHRQPFRGPAEGLGNSVLVKAAVSADGQRLFGNDLVVFRVNEATLIGLKKAKHELWTELPCLVTETDA